MQRSTSDGLLMVSSNQKAPISEVYRTLRTNIQYSYKDSPLQLIMITSAQTGEGKTTTACNLAIAFAQEKKRVLLIDADLSNPSLHTNFSLSNRDGLMNLFAGQTKLRETVKDTIIDNLFILTSGPKVSYPFEMFGTEMMKNLLDECREQYDVIVIDSPSTLLTNDSLVLSTLCDGVVLVVAAGETRKENMKKVKESLDHVNARLIGVVLNKIVRNNSAK